MASQAREGAWKFVGGRLCLDFVNTVGGRVGTPRATTRNFADHVVREKLTGYGDLVGWGQLAGVLTARDRDGLLRASRIRPSEADRVYRRSLDLREAAYRLFKAALEGWEPRREDAQVLNQEVSVARTHERLVGTSKGFTWEWDDRGPLLDRVVWPLACSVADLLTSKDLARVRQCGGLECGWLFLDTSRNRSRQWCDMRDCGNLAKVRRFRQRHRNGG